MSKALHAAIPASKIERPQPKIAALTSALETDEFTHFVRMDVADFYPSVSHKWMRSVLAAEVRSKSLRALCLQAILNETVADGHRPNGKSLGRGIPQGLAVSNALAELALMHVDAAMTTRTDVAYFRYVDDIVVLTKRRREQKTFEEVSALLRRAGVAAHPLNKPGSKSHGGKIRDGFEYLGYKFDWPRITVRPASVGKLEAALARSFTRYRYARDGVPRTTAKQWPDRCREKLKWHLDLIIAGCVFEGSRRGWLSYFSQIRHMQLLEHLDSLVIGLSRRFGLPSTATFKSFKKAYRFAATKRPDLTGYVPNLDKFTRAERESVLERIFFERRSVLSSLTDEQVEERFRQRVKRVVQEMERDIGAFS